MEEKKLTLIYGWTQATAYETPENLWPYFESAEGVSLKTTTGEIFIDGKSMMKCVSFGHGNPEILAAARQQLDKLAYVPTMDNFRNQQAEVLAEMLVELTGSVFRHVYLSTTGTASVETAIMIALMYFKSSGLPGKVKIGSVATSYHGQSLKMKSICAADEVKELYNCRDDDSFQVAPPYCRHCPFGREPNSCAFECAAALEEKILALGADKIAAFLVEPVASEKLLVPPKEYYTKIRKITARYGILLIFDEVITGFGRIGTHFAYEYYGIIPDLICLGKSINNGILPLGATLFSHDIFRKIRDGNMGFEFGSTQDGNPVCCAAAIATLNYYRKHRCWENAETMGKYLAERLRALIGSLPIVDDVRGIGLYLGIELNESSNSENIVDREDALRRCFIAEKLAVHIEKDFVLITPALTINQETADEIAMRTARALKKAAEGK